MQGRQRVCKWHWKKNGVVEVMEAVELQSPLGLRPNVGPGLERVRKTRESERKLEREDEG